ncbi:MAG: hypothetical protein AAF493_24300 [Pseudomonadota bacterium]
MTKVGKKDTPLDERKSRDRAWLVPLVGMMLLLPPVAGAFQLDLRAFGVPFTALYLFVVWALLIFCAWRISRSLSLVEPSSLVQGSAVQSDESSEPRL